MGKLDHAINQRYLRLEWITPQRFQKAKEFRLRFQDKPHISFTDLTSMAVMEELELIPILTNDEHFTHVGMDFQLVP